MVPGLEKSNLSANTIILHLQDSQLDEKQQEYLRSGLTTYLGSDLTCEPRVTFRGATTIIWSSFTAFGGFKLFTSITARGPTKK